MITGRGLLIGVALGAAYLWSTRSRLDRATWQNVRTFMYYDEAYAFATSSEGQNRRSDQKGRSWEITEDFELADGKTVRFFTVWIDPNPKPPGWW